MISVSCASWSMALARYAPARRIRREAMFRLWRLSAVLAGQRPCLFIPRRPGTKHTGPRADPRWPPQLEDANSGWTPIRVCLPVVHIRAGDNSNSRGMYANLDTLAYGPAGNGRDACHWGRRSDEQSAPPLRSSSTFLSRWWAPAVRLSPLVGPAAAQAALTVLGTWSPLVRQRVGHHIVGVFKETASGAKKDRVERKKVLALVQAREIDAILITELSRWGRSIQDLVQTLDDLHSWKISVLAPAWASTSAPPSG